MSEGIHEQAVRLRRSHKRASSRSLMITSRGYLLARWAHREGRRRELHVQRRCKLQGSQLLELLLEPPVLIAQRLAAPLQNLAVDFGLLELSPGYIYIYRRENKLR